MAGATPLVRICDTSAMIHLTDVTKTYRANSRPVHALAGVTVDISPGEFIVLQGPSGSGKSTLLAVIAGLSRPSSGQVIVGGEDLGSLSAGGRARLRAERMGFVFQAIHLLPYLTVVDNVAMAASAAQSANARQRAVELLERVHMGHRLTHRPGELSVGEAQRVAIARAMMNRPQLILADEPTGNLDQENAGGVLELLSQFHGEGGTVVLVTHQAIGGPSSRRTIRLRDGVLCQGTGDGDMANPA